MKTIWHRLYLSNLPYVTSVLRLTFLTFCSHILLDPWLLIPPGCLQKKLIPCRMSGTIFFLNSLKNSKSWVGYCFHHIMVSISTLYNFDSNVYRNGTHTIIGLDFHSTHMVSIKEDIVKSLHKIVRNNFYNMK